MMDETTQAEEPMMGRQRSCPADGRCASAG